MAPGSVDPITLDWIALGIFFFCTVVYHLVYHLWATVRPFDTVKGKVERYRKDWVEQVLATRNIIMAVQTIRNTIMATTWMAGSVLLVVAFLITGGIQGTIGASGGDEGTFQIIRIPADAFIIVKLDLLLILFGFAFLMFLFTIRHLILFNTLIGTSPELITQVEGIEASEYLGQIINKAHNRFTFGLRSTYYSIPAIAWLFNTYAFIVLTVVLWLWLLFVMDTRAPFGPTRRAHHP